jgi:hypothetical protein
VDVGLSKKNAVGLSITNICLDILSYFLFTNSESAWSGSDNTLLTMKVVCDKGSGTENVIFGITSSCLGVGVLRSILVICLISVWFRLLVLGLVC